MRYSTVTKAQEKNYKAEFGSENSNVTTWSVQLFNLLYQKSKFIPLILPINHSLHLILSHRLKIGIFRYSYFSRTQLRDKFYPIFILRNNKELPFLQNSPTMNTTQMSKLIQYLYNLAHTYINAYLIYLQTSYPFISFHRINRVWGIQIGTWRGLLQHLNLMITEKRTEVQNKSSTYKYVKYLNQNTITQF